MQNQRIDRLTAVDIMRKDIVIVGPSDSLKEAMSLMTENHVSGLPVLNSRDRCVGVISATDIMNFEQEQSEFAAETAHNVAPYFDPLRNRWETIRVRGGIDKLPDVPVGDVMTRELIGVRPSTSIRKVAQKMLDEEIHRVLVLDEDLFLHGIISAVDFVRLFAERL